MITSLLRRLIALFVVAIIVISLSTSIHPVQADVYHVFFSNPRNATCFPSGPPNGVTVTVDWESNAPSGAQLRATVKENGTVRGSNVVAALFNTGTVTVGTSVVAPMPYTLDYVFELLVNGQTTSRSTITWRCIAAGPTTVTIDNDSLSPGSKALEFFTPGDGRINGRPGDRIAAWCNTSGEHAGLLDVYGVDDRGKGFQLTTFNLPDVVAAGSKGITKDLGPTGSVSASSNGQGDFWVAWNGGSFGANGSGDFAKGLNCNIPGDNRLNGRPGDRLAVYCNAAYGFLDIYGVVDGKGLPLARFSNSALVVAGSQGLTKHLDENGSLSISGNGKGDFYVAWNGGRYSATGQGDFAKSFHCELMQGSGVGTNTKDVIPIATEQAQQNPPVNKQQGNKNPNNPEDLIQFPFPINYSVKPAVDNCAQYVNDRFREGKLPRLGKLGATQWATMMDSRITGIRYDFKDSNTSGTHRLGSAKLQGDLRTSGLKPGHVVVWEKGLNLGQDTKYGHAAIIKEVYQDYVVIEENSWNGKTPPQKPRHLGREVLSQLIFLGY